MGIMSTEPLRISVEIAREMLEFDIHESPYVFKRTGIAHLVDERVKPLVEVLRDCEGVIEELVPVDQSRLERHLERIRAALKDVGVE
jgi:hypothetical protein